MSALDKAKAENEALRQRQAARTKKERSTRSMIVNEVVGEAGAALSAIACAAADAKYADVGEMATFGKTKVPAAPVVGLFVALGSLALVKAAPTVSTGIRSAGMFAVDLGLYFTARDKVSEWVD
jgi:hypothetical protein